MTDDNETKKWERKAESVQATINTHQIDINPIEWIVTNAQSDDLMLAHALDGVIWGRFINDRWATPSTSPPLQLATIQQIRVFNAKYEYHLWKRRGDKWMVRKIVDGNGDAGQNYKIIDEDQILFGTSNHLYEEHFSHMTQGEEGLVHAVPVPFETDSINTDRQPNKRAVLQVRHYLEPDQHTAVTTIIANRLVTIKEMTYA